MNYPIIPKPQRITADDTAVFTLTRYCEIDGEDKFPKAVSALKKFLSESFSIELLGTGRERISLALNDETEDEEGYSLSVRKDEVIIRGKTEKGIFYGIQTLKQMLMYGDLTLCKTEITDCPAFPYRGFMLDSGRYFFTKEAIFTFLEIMALHKLNNFHWHLTEDQGWRFYSENQLLLTEIGSYRSHTNFNTIPHSGYYTKEDMKEIVEYAHSLFIKVIPEIDTPGHTVSAIAAYPHLSCFDRNLVTATSWGVKHDVLCVGKESTYEFMYSLLDEVSEIFTDGIIHIGGDEVPTTRWKLCPHCQKRKEEEGLKETADLHTYYLNRIGEYLRSKGTEVIMWNDRVKDYMPDSKLCWQFWSRELNREDISGEIKKGRPFIISPVNAYYLDLPYGTTDLKTCYDYDPYIEGVTQENKHLLKGVEACLWTEFVPSMEKAEYCMFPRLGAISESAWTKKENKSYEDFYERLPGYYKHIKAINFTHATLKQALPKGIRKAASKLYWERRKLCWGGLENLIDNKIVEKKHGRKDTKNA
ncbi:MAG: beta-N-acetylhexosaminidase [Clostridia bacterium]|nr:beta-N-acetylhexosaminidase [Clostridia bacterium]